MFERAPAEAIMKASMIQWLVGTTVTALVLTIAKLIQ
jgi:hypothetical protein